MANEQNREREENNRSENSGNFKNNPERASEAGRKGGEAHKRKSRLPG